MAYYRECDKCGCALDPGERCDCEQEAQRKEQEAQRKEQERQKMIFVGRNGQMTFSLTKEESNLEKAVV